jgi:hypothetical protein
MGPLHKKFLEQVKIGFCTNTGKLLWRKQRFFVTNRIHRLLVVCRAFTPSVATPLL